jgi:hypothetical protein
LTQLGNRRTQSVQQLQQIASAVATAPVVHIRLNTSAMASTQPATTPTKSAEYP